MKITTGLFDEMVLQRTASNCSKACFSGTTDILNGVVVASARRSGGTIVRGLARVRAGYARRGRFEGVIKGLPAGGPYDIELEIQDPLSGASEGCTIRDVLVGDVWILAGQSNMQGCGRLVKGNGVDRLVRAFYMGDNWDVAKDPLHDMWNTVDRVHIDLCGGVAPPKGTVVWGAGPGVAFAREMKRLSGGVPQGVIACAHGGTSMRQWDPSLRRKGSGSLYGAMLRRFVKNGSSVAGVFWYQGCSDALPEDASLYTKRMKKFVASVRRDFADSRLPFVIVQISRVTSWTEKDAWLSVQDQQRRLPDVISRCTVVPAIDLELDDQIHIAGVSQDVLGRRAAHALAVMTGLTRGRPPIRIAGVSHVAEPGRGTANAVVSFSNLEGVLKSQGRPSGFLVKSPLDAENRAFDVELAGRKAIVRTLLPMTNIGEMDLYYGGELDPYCNITDSTGRPLPVFGPIRIGPPVAASDYIRKLAVSPVMDFPDGLDKMGYPGSGGSLPGMKERVFAWDFCDVHMDFFDRVRSGVYFRSIVRCPERMRGNILLGYDGPVKAWVDGEERFHDPAGTNPAVQDAARISVDFSAGDHEVLVALDCNNGRAWGIFLRFRRTDLPARLLRKGPSSYSLPDFI